MLKILKQIYKFAEPFKWKLFIVFLLIISVSSINAANSYFLSQIFNIIQGANDIQQSIKWIYYAFGLIIIRIIILRSKEIIEIKYLDLEIENHFNYKSVSKFFDFSNGQHINENSGVKQNIVRSGGTSIQNQINSFIYLLMPTISDLIISIFILFKVNIYIGISYVVFASVYGYMIYYLNKFIHPRLEKQREISNKNHMYLTEMFRYVFLIKNEVAEKKTINELHKRQNNLQGVFSNTWTWVTNYFTSIRLVSESFKWGTILISLIYIKELNILSGDIFLLFVWSGNFFTSIWYIMDMQKRFISDKVNIEKYMDLLEIEPDIKLPDNPKDISDIESIEFKDVSFYYPKRDGLGDNSENKVLKNINFIIRKGEKVAFVGESGSGKSTIGNILRRGFDPQEGKVLVNDIDIKEINLKQYLGMIGSVDQDVILFDDSIRNNISFGISSVLTDSELDEISKVSGVNKFKDKLENGWDTMIGEDGSKISGGEKQRIGIARALAKSPKMIFFDEATSALDTLSEKEVQESIDNSIVGNTAVIIAHRISTIRNCDKIIVMKNGEIVGVGTHRQLIKNCDYYKELIKNQENLEK